LRVQYSGLLFRPSSVVLHVKKRQMDVLEGFNFLIAQSLVKYQIHEYFS
jgi:hypothetical protein